MTKLYFQIDSTYEEDDRELRDEWDRPDSWSSHELVRAFLSEGSRYRDSCPIDFGVAEGDQVFAIFAVWSTGDSFSHDSGMYREVIAVYKTRELADAACKALDTDDNTVYYAETGKMVQFVVPWAGYFESLDSIDVVPLTVYK